MENAIQISIRPVAFVSNNRTKPDEFNWGEVISEIVVADEIPNDCLRGIDAFSHLEIIFYFHELDDKSVVYDLRHPRNDPKYPLTGIFAQRGRARPNKLGATIVRVIEVKKRSVLVKGLDAINNTPVIDIKPVMKEFLPREEVRQPDWSRELMRSYWTKN